MKFIEDWYEVLLGKQGTMTLQVEEVNNVVKLLNGHVKEIGYDLLIAK